MNTERRSSVYPLVVTLEELTLDSSKVTDPAIDHLAGLRNLRKLHISRTRITAAGRERLKTLRWSSVGWGRRHRGSGFELAPS